VISALLGHATPMTGFGAASRMTPGYAHATWDTMADAVTKLEKPVTDNRDAPADSTAKPEQMRKAS